MIRFGAEAIRPLSDATSAAGAGRSFAVRRRPAMSDKPMTTGKTREGGRDGTMSERWRDELERRIDALEEATHDAWTKEVGGDIDTARAALPAALDALDAAERERDEAVALLRRRMGDEDNAVWLYDVMDLLARLDGDADG